MKLAAVRYVIAAAVGAAALACAHRTPGLERSAPCAPVSGSLAPGTSLAPLAGRFALTMVATYGPRQGQRVDGIVTLRNAPPEAPAPSSDARTVLVGVTDVAVESVGAQRLGDLAADDPRAPGVAVYEQRASGEAPSVTARLGSASTGQAAPGLVRIEGSWTALRILRIAPDAFAGSWSSGDGAGTEARGHFCAVRLRS